MPSARVKTWHEREALALAVRVAKAAARAAIAEGSRGRRVRAVIGRETKIAADRALHRLIADRLQRASGWPVVSEEGDLGSPSALDARPRWIIDPLDGSVNVSRRFPIAGVSIALWHGLQPRLGVICDVFRDECFSGIVGRGAWLNGRRIRVSDVQDASNAILCTGFPVRSDLSREGLERFIGRVQRYRKIRMLGAASLMMAYVACGRADVYQEERIALWDVAAGIALVEAAGGVVRRGALRPDWSFSVMAGTPAVIGSAASTNGAGRVASGSTRVTHG